MSTPLYCQIRKIIKMIPKLNDNQIEFLLKKVIRTYVANLKPFPSIKNQGKHFLFIEIIKN